MKIAQLMKYSAPYLGNFMRSMFFLENGLRNNGDSMVYIFMNHSPDIEWMNSLGDRNVYFLSGNIIKDFFLLRSILKREQVDIVHTHFVEIKYTSILYFIKQLSGLQYVLIRHLHNLYDKRSIEVEKIKNIISPFQASIACGEVVAERYDAVKINKLEQVYCATNAIDFSRFDVKINANKPKLGIPLTAKVFLMFGTDFFRKGVDIAIDAFEKINSNGVGTILLLCTSQSKQQVESEILKTKDAIPSWIRIVPPIEDVSAYFEMSDAFISASRSEGFCYALLEASYCGCDLIYSDIEEHTSARIPNTYIFANEDSTDLFHQICLFLKTSGEDIEKGQVERKMYVKSMFSLDKWSKKITDIYYYYKV